MVNDPPKVLSQAEWKVMKVVWRLQSCAARDISEQTEHHYDMTDVTTRTLLRRLVEKGHIKTRQIGNSYLYEPVSSMIDTICEAADELLDNTPNKAAKSLMFHMVNQGKLSGEDIKELRNLLDSYET